MIGTAEHTGKLGEVMELIGEFYEDEGERSIRQAIKLLEPAIIVVMGVVVGAALRRSLADDGLEVLAVPWGSLAAVFFAAVLIGVVGAGNMGSGIAQKIATEGIDVTVVDLGKEALERGRRRVEETLQAVGQTPAPNEELRSLRDRANVALGFATLAAQQPREARLALQRVRLNGPSSNKALLGYGWAAAELKEPQLALAPWTELAGRGSAGGADASVLVRELSEELCRRIDVGDADDLTFAAIGFVGVF